MSETCNWHCDDRLVHMRAFVMAVNLQADSLKQPLLLPLGWPPLSLSVVVKCSSFAALVCW